MLPDTDWIKRVCAKPVENIIQWDLGYGETEVLSFAFANRDYTPVLDDTAAKKCSLSLGIPSLGTGTVLIREPVEKIYELRKKGFWISNGLIEKL
jgi:predicted nucleic acid-binding protein